MRIALRPSGGRGDYELAGSYNNQHASDLLEKRFFFQITPSLTIQGKARAHRLSGKPRVRPEEAGEHPYKVISSLLLLPPPRRELAKTGDSVLTALAQKEYILAGIDVEVVDSDLENVTFAPTNVWAKNQSSILKVDFSERMAIISTLWAASGIANTAISSLLATHKNAVTSSDHKSITGIAEQIQKRYRTNEDVLPFILHELKLPSDGVFYTGITDDTAGYETEDIVSKPGETVRERIKKWRKQADRGPGARDFSILVRKAYDYRCLFSGERFPKLEPLDSAGVDGAHILPWSTHQLNSVVNGVCLCKQCHWGFDNGLLKLDFDHVTNSYLLSIPKDVEDAAIKEKFDLARFTQHTGVVDKSKLPKNQDLWPSPEHIREFNAKFSV